MTPCPVLPCATVCEGLGGGHLSPSLTHHHMADERQSQISHAHVLGGFTCTLVSRISSAVLPRRGPGPTFLGSTAGKGADRFPCQLEVVGARRGIFPSPLLLRHRWGRRCQLCWTYALRTGSLVLVYRVSSTDLPRQGTGHILLSVSAAVGWIQVPHLLLVARGKGRNISITMWQVRPAFPFSRPRAQFALVPENRVSSIGLPSWGIGSSLCLRIFHQPSSEEILLFQEK